MNLIQVNLIQALMATGAISLVSFTSLPVALSKTSNSNFLTRESTQMMTELPASFQPGLNRVIFQRENERMWATCTCLCSGIFPG